MSRVITFSTSFPSNHPRNGVPTYFVEKIWKGLYPEDPDEALFSHEVSLIWSVYKEIYLGLEPKHHTIRAGHRFKVGDWFSPRVWSGKPYNSKQVMIAPDIQVKKIWDFELKWASSNLYGFINGNLVYNDVAEKLATNDGLTLEDMDGWFNKPFEGQIICWNENIEY